MNFDTSQRYLAKTQAEFLKLLDNTLFKLEEYIFCVQEDLEDELDDPHHFIGAGPGLSENH